MADHMVDEPEKGDKIPRAVLGRQVTIGFQNGVRDRGGEGIDTTALDGYEGSANPPTRGALDRLFDS